MESQNLQYKSATHDQIEKLYWIAKDNKYVDKDTIKVIYEYIEENLIEAYYTFAEAVKLCKPNNSFQMICNGYITNMVHYSKTPNIFGVKLFDNVLDGFLPITLEHLGGRWIKDKHIIKISKLKTFTYKQAIYKCLKSKHSFSFDDNYSRYRLEFYNEFKESKVTTYGVNLLNITGKVIYYPHEEIESIDFDPLQNIINSTVQYKQWYKLDV